MNPMSHTAPTHPEDNTGGHQDAGNPLPSNWREALLTLIASRTRLLQLESKQAAKDGARRVALLVGVVFCAFFTWALLLAGLIAAVSKAAAWPWYWIAIGTAAVHLAAALLFARAAKSQRAPAFPVTRAEFQKDREWIENFQKPRKSNI